MKKIKKILIIDDDAMTALLHKRLLERMELAQEIEFITDPFKALGYMHQQYASGTYTASGHDLIFLDIDMPGMNGFEFLEELSSLKIDYSQISIILLTSSMYYKDKQKAATYGDTLHGYLVKPLQKESLAELLGERWGIQQSNT